MIEKSKSKKLNITGMVDDMYVFDSYKDFDIVLLDSIFHFEKRDLKSKESIIKELAMS